MMTGTEELLADAAGIARIAAKATSREALECVKIRLFETAACHYREAAELIHLAIDLEPMAADAEQLAYAVRNAAACNVIAERWRARDGS